MNELDINKIYYTFDEWEKDTEKIINIIKKEQSKENIHLITPMFGGIPIANKIRNKIDCKLSLVKMSRYAERDLKASWVYNDNISVDEELIIIDDIYDSGVTLKETLDLVRKGYPNNKVRVIAIFSTPNPPVWLEFLHSKQDEDWISFPWE